MHLSEKEHFFGCVVIKRNPLADFATDTSNSQWAGDRHEQAVNFDNLFQSKKNGQLHQLFALSSGSERDDIDEIEKAFARLSDLLR